MDQVQRDVVVAETLRWLSTPYHPHGRLRGVGVDCVMLLAEVYGPRGAGLVPDVDPGEYSVQAGLHSRDEVLLELVQRHGTEVPRPLPGDAVLIRYGRSYSHAGIMISETRLVHAHAAVGLVCMTDLTDAEIAGRERRHFTIGGIGT